MDAITLLKADHKTVKGLFAKFDKAGDTAFQTKREIVDKIIEELSVHAGIEELVFYPAVRGAVPETNDEVLESLEEHHIVKWLLSELEDMDPKAERFTAKVTVLKENTLHHAEEEEAELFPIVRKALGRNELQKIGAQLEAAKRTVPRRPHPKAPDTPPGNLVATPAAAIADRARGVLRGRGRSTRPKTRAT
ncbi:MAG TPA: hemerythrin domain-containing protein [Acidimicrobiales bacterium]|nr:hemerythrin domain-containing protein [Acidimicrobiales bacterium]